MRRRRFLVSSLAASGLVLSASSKSPFRGQEAAERKGREYYELRRYHLRAGPQEKLTDEFLRQALVPALNRLGISPVGVFNVEIGPLSPSRYVLMPGDSADALLSVEARLGQDDEYLKAGAAFLNAPAQQPAYVRMESSLMRAFEGMPRLAVPAATAQRRSRLFELRTYESPSDQDHKRKVEMFNSGEFDIFQKAGFWQVFYGDTLIGPRLPNLTYMIGFENLADRDKKWAVFGSFPEWKKLSNSPRYAFEDIVSNITNVILGPTEYSQI
jgi:hypothetical protein